MADAKILRIYLDDIPRKRALDGKFNIINRITAAFQGQGFRVELCRNTVTERGKSATRRGYSLFHMDAPFHPRALTLRKAYFYPFWRIENTASRWEYQIARSPFRPDDIDETAATQFCDYWRRQLFPEPLPTTRDDTVYVPLQGVLLERRSFQSLSPLDMIRAVLAHDPTRDVVAGLHPGETYIPEEIEALKTLVDAEPRLRLSSEPMAHLLSRADYVATENSSVALNGFFLGKPAALFARIDFHHIAANVADLGPDQAIAQAPSLTPDYDKFLYWFLKLTAINGGAPEAEDQILAAVRHHGWKI